MTIGLVQNARDKDVIDICGGNGTPDAWPYVWTAVHSDCISDAVEGELLDNDGCRFEEVVECVIVTWREWKRLTAKVDDLERKIEAIQSVNDALNQEVFRLEQELDDQRR
jgi:hypothetical protein